MQTVRESWGNYVTIKQILRQKVLPKIKKYFIIIKGLIHQKDI